MTPVLEASGWKQTLARTMSRRRRMEHLYARNLSGRDAAQFARGRIDPRAQNTKPPWFPDRDNSGRGARIEDRLILWIAERVGRVHLWFEALRKHARLRLPDGGGKERVAYVRVISPRESRHVEQSRIKSRLFVYCSLRAFNVNCCLSPNYCILSVRGSYTMVRMLVTNLLRNFVI